MRPDIPVEGNIGRDSDNLYNGSEIGRLSEQVNERRESDIEGDVDTSSSVPTRLASPAETFSEKSISVKQVGDTDGEGDFDDDQHDELPDIEDRRPVCVYSLDMDNCFLPDCSVYDSFSTVFDRNHSFIAEILNKKARNNEKVIFLMGGAAQGPGLKDVRKMLQSNAYPERFSESGFFAMKEFVDQVNLNLPEKSQIILDTFLLDDIYYKKNFGESFDCALKLYGEKWSNVIREALNSEKKIYPDMVGRLYSFCSEVEQRLISKLLSEKSVFLERPGKFILLYQQMHHIASRYSEHEKLEFHFYDDSMDVLSRLVAIFRAHPDLIPKNLKLYFHSYIDGKDQKKFLYFTDDSDDEYSSRIRHDYLQGIGPIDFCFEDTFQEMIACIPQKKEVICRVSVDVQVGDLIDSFFEIFFDGCFKRDEFLSSATTVVPTNAFHLFNKKRVERIKEAEKKTPSLGCFEEEDELAGVFPEAVVYFTGPRLTPLYGHGLFKGRNPHPDIPHGPACLLESPEMSLGQ